MANLKQKKRTRYKKPSSGKAKESENLVLEIKRIERKLKEGDSIVDFSKGYVDFVVYLAANGKKIEIDKRVRLDKSDKMLKKFISKIKLFAETRYRERKYFISQEPAPEETHTKILNEAEVADAMLEVFEEINQFIKTGKASHIKTLSVEF